MHFTIATGNYESSNIYRMQIHTCTRIILELLHGLVLASVGHPCFHYSVGGRRVRERMPKIATQFKINYMHNNYSSLLYRDFPVDLLTY